MLRNISAFQNLSSAAKRPIQESDKETFNPFPDTTNLQQMILNSSGQKYG